MCRTPLKRPRCVSSGIPIGALLWDYCTMEIRAGLSSKLFASMLERVMLEAMPWTPRAMKSRNVLLCSPLPPAMVGEVSRVLHLCFSTIYFLLLKQKVLSISWLSSYWKKLHIKEENSYMHNHQHYQCNQKEKENKVKHLVNFVRLTQ